MVPVEPISLSIAIATLFTTCIECFEYFKAAKGFERHFEVLLVKLEYQQERLLVWGDLAGVCSEKQDSERIIAESERKRQDLTKRCLESIHQLLKDTENLKTKYGVRAYTATNDTTPHSGISANALKRFRLRLGRQSPGCSVLDKTRWAIHDASKFEKLIDDIRDLIDGLTTKVPVSPELQEQKVQDDIASMVDDIQSLHLFQEACKNDYPKWWTAASAAIDASEVATQDDRLANARLEHHYSLNQGSLGAGVGKEELPVYFGDRKVYLFPRTQVFFMLTESCRAQDTETPCDPVNLGPKCFLEKYSFIAEGSIRTHSAPGYRITKYVDPSEFTHINIKNYLLDQQFRKTHAIAKEKGVTEDNINLHVWVYIYCPPCVCQIATALDICRYNHQKAFVNFCIRVDHRLKTTCSASSSRIEGVISILNHLKETEKDKSLQNYPVEDLKVFDREWLEQQVWDYTEDNDSTRVSPANQLARIAGFHSRDDPFLSCAAIVFLGEADYIIPLMGVPPFRPFEPGRQPRETQLFRSWQEYMGSDEWSWQRQFLGTYSPKFPLPTKRPAPVDSEETHAMEYAERSPKRSKNSTSDQEGA